MARALILSFGRRFELHKQQPTPGGGCILPPLAGFLPDNPEDAWRARTIDLKEGYALSVECDEYPKRARNKLEAVIGPTTVVVESGGQWLNPETGELESKVHLHWRLQDQQPMSNSAS